MTVLLDAEVRERIRLERDKDIRSRLVMDSMERINGKAGSHARTHNGSRRTRKHGTINEYSNYGCRCSLCKKANAGRMRRQRQNANKIPCHQNCGRKVSNPTYNGTSGLCRSCSARRRALERGKNSTVRHGTESCYNKGCRRPECTRASSEGRKQRRLARGNAIAA